MTTVTTIDGLAVRRRLGRDTWGIPNQFGPDCWYYDAKDHSGRIIVTGWPHADGRDWIHASISRVDVMPTYEDLKQLHAAVWPHGFAYQVFVPPADHVNIHAFALHLWGLASGEPAFPPFEFGGTI